MQIGEGAQFFRNAARQSVVVKVQPLQIREIAQFFRNAARQLFSVKIQLGHTRIGDSDAIPSVYGSRFTPVE